MSGPANDILLFQVGPRVFASVVHDAVRIGSAREVAAEDLIFETALGAPFGRERGIVVSTRAPDAGHEPGGPGHAVERMMLIDRVVGIRAVTGDELVPLPPFAASCLSSGALIGFVVLDETPTLLVDLPTLVRERLAAVAAAT